MIDLNGIFHTSAQKIFKYGSFKPPGNITISIPNDYNNQKRVYMDVCHSIETILVTVNPNKRLILCVDGSAPISKQLQQARRRYVSSLTRADDDTSFDSNCISPGTKFMDGLNRFLDGFIKRKLAEDPLWQNLDIIFSNDKVESEGEHKLQSYVRKYGKPNETFMIHGLDSDLIMLSLISHCSHFYVLRDDTFDRNNNFLLLDMPKIRPCIIDYMRWDCVTLDYDDKPIYKFNETWAINDFVFLCFMVGNDFLHHVPALEIIEGGIDVIINCCKEVCSHHGHITRHTNGRVIFSPKSLAMFFDKIASYEKDLLERKMVNRKSYFPDEILIQSVAFNTSTMIYEADIEKYRLLYCQHHFDKSNNEEMYAICHEYLDGLQWVLHYYSTGVADWTWFFKYHYTPPAKVIADSLASYMPKVFKKNKPLLPFQQLLYILPHKSANLLPVPFDDVLRKYKPNTEEVEIDLSGKKYEYQGVVLLPFQDLKVIHNLYKKYYAEVPDVDKKRNYLGKTFLYKFTPQKGVSYNYIDI
jgi:5'-3' exonuclease